MAQGRNLTVYLTSDVSKFRKGLKQADTAMDKFRRGTAVAAGAAAAAVGAVAVVAFDAAKAAVANEQSQSRLAQTLKQTVRATQGQIDAYEDYIDAAQKKSGLDDGDLRTGNERLLRSTKDVTKAQELATIAMGIAVQTGKDFPTVAAAVAKAYDGNAGALKRLGINIPKGDKIDLLKELNKQFGGSLAADAETYAGSMRRVGTAADELLESFGDGLLGETGVAGDMDELTRAMYDAQPAAEGAGRALNGMMVAVLEQLPNFVLGMQALPTVFDNFVNTLSGGVTNARDFFSPILPPALGLSDQDAEAMRRAQAAQQARNDAYLAGLVAGITPTAPNPYEQYRPMRYSQRAIDAKGRADGRAAQTDSRTRARP